MLLSSSRSCIRRAATSRQYHNEGILALLARYREAEENAPDRNGYRIRAYNAAIEEIKYLDKPITSAADASAIRGIGPGIAKRIEQYLEGYDPKTLNQHQRSREEAKKRAVLVLSQVPGIGVTKAKDLVSQGCMTIDDIRNPKFTEQLTAPQKIQLKYYEHLREPVTRAEIELITDFIRRNISSKFEVLIAGAYRRGFPISSDIDILLFHPDHVHIPTPSVRVSSLEKLKIRANRRGRLDLAFREAHTPSRARSESLLLQDVVPILEERGLIAETLRSGSRKWQGLVRIPEEEDGMAEVTKKKERIRAIKLGKGTYRRVDINLVPVKSRGAALLALTGDIEFNRSLKLKAVKMGMYLDEFGLWRWNGNDSNEEGHNGSNPAELDPPKRKSKKASISTSEPASDLTTSDPTTSDPKSQSAPISGKSNGYWELIRAETEESIFAELGMDFVEPTRRNFSYLVNKENRTKVPKVVKPVVAS